MDWQRLAQAVIDRRVELGHRTREAFAAHTGLSSRLLGDLERAKRTNYDRVTLARLEQALGWPSGRVLEILRSALPDHDLHGGHSIGPTDYSDPFEAHLARLRFLRRNMPAELREQLFTNLTFLVEWADGRMVKDGIFPPGPGIVVDPDSPEGQEADRRFAETMAHVASHGRGHSTVEHAELGTLAGIRSPND